MLSDLLWNKSQTYVGTKLLAILYIIFALLRNKLSSNDWTFNIDLASSKSVYSFPKIVLNARFWSFVIFHG